MQREEEIDDDDRRKVEHLRRGGEATARLNDIDYELEEMRKRDEDLKVKEQNFERQRAWQKKHGHDYCLGCGGKLQTDDPLGMAYVPPDLLETVRTQPLRKKFVSRKQNQRQSPWLEQASELLARRPATVEEVYPEGNVPTDDHDPTEFRTLRDLELEEGVEERTFVCVRCHALRSGQLNKLGTVDLAWQTSESVRKTLRQMFGHRKFLAVVIVDLANFEASFIPDLEQIIGGNRVLLVGNKFDLLPVGVNEERVRVWLKSRAEERRLDNIRRTLVLSAETGEGMRKLCAEINCLRADDDVVLIGATNVGKSTLINGLVPRLFPGAKTHATTSGLPGTTLNLITFPFDGPSPSFLRQQGETREQLRKTEAQARGNPYSTLKLVGPSYPYDVKAQKREVEELPSQPVPQIKAAPKLIDTPGFVLYDSIDHLLLPTELRGVQIHRRIRPVIFRLVEGKTIFLGGMARVDYVKGPPLYLTVFASRELTLHASSIATADALYLRQKGNLLAPPVKKLDDPQRLDRFPLLEPVKVVVNTADVYDPKSWRTAFTDISIGGIGWVSLTGGSKDRVRCQFHVHVPAGISVFARPPLMPFEAEPTKRKAVQKHGKVAQNKAILHPLTRPRTVG